MTSKKSEATPKVGSGDPTSGGEVGSRISLVVGLYKTKAEAARAAGITAEMLNRYARGEHKLPLEKAMGLCAPVGVSLNWLAWETGPMMLRDCMPQAVTSPSEPGLGRIDEVILSNLVHGLEAFALKEDLEFDPSTKAKLTVLFYRLMVERRRHTEAAGTVPAELREPGHPIDIANDPLFADIVRIAE